jgi:hypothetical protein
VIRRASAAALGLAMVLTAAQGDASSHRGPPWTYAHRTSSHRSPSHRSTTPAAFYKRQCKAKCHDDYEIDVAGCSAEPRGQKGECRHLESLSRKDCLAHCI